MLRQLLDNAREDTRRLAFAAIVRRYTQAEQPLLAKTRDRSLRKNRFAINFGGMFLDLRRDPGRHTHKLQSVIIQAVDIRHVKNASLRPIRCH